MTVLLAGAASFVALAAPVSADGDVREFPFDTIYGGLDAITTGADGNLWLAVNGGVGNHVGRLTTDGEFTEFEIQGPGTIRMLEATTDLTPEQEPSGQYR